AIAPGPALPSVRSDGAADTAGTPPRPADGLCDDAAGLISSRRNRRICIQRDIHVAGRASGPSVGTLCDSGASSAALRPCCALGLRHDAPGVRPLSGDMCGSKSDVDIARAATCPAMAWSSTADIVVQTAAHPAGPPLQNGIDTGGVISRCGD